MTASVAVCSGWSPAGRQAATMGLAGSAIRLRVYVSEGDHIGGDLLAHRIVVRAKEMGLGGATVVRGVGGFGVHHRIHSHRLVEVEGDLPLVVEIIDTEERVRSLLPVLAEMVREGMVTMDPVEVVLHQGSPAEG